MIRSLIVWLVLLGVPFQGFAAAAALPCPASAMAQAAPMHHPMASGALHRHHATAQRGQPGPDAPAHHGGSAHDASAKCGSCPACWVGAAMASALPVVGAHPARCMTIPFDAGHVPSVHPPLPERPPRLARA